MDSIYLFLLPGCEECLQMREELDEILFDMESPPEVIVYDYGDDEDLFTELCIEFGIDNPPACVINEVVFQDELDVEKVMSLLSD